MALAVELITSWKIESDTHDLNSELTLNVYLRNFEDTTKEFRVLIYDANGTLRAQLPASFWKNIDSNKDHVFEFTTAGILGAFLSAKNFYPVFQVHVYEQHAGFQVKEIINISNGETIIIPAGSKLDNHSTQITPEIVAKLQLPPEFIGGGGNYKPPAGNGVLENISDISKFIMVAVLGIVAIFALSKFKK